MPRQTDPRDVLAAIDAFPYPPGDGPFHIKGNGYRGKLQYIDSLAGGRQGVEVLERPAIAEFYDQNFLASVRYDIVPLLATTAAIAIIHDESFETRSIARARGSRTR